MARRQRNYQAVAARIQPSGAVEDRLRAVVDHLWDALHELGVSWVGFYLDQPREPDGRRLTLGPCRDKPACSPIGLHGVCGKALTTGQTQIVKDVAELGPEYIACDPMDRSEIVVPVIDREGRCWAVLDLDSYDLGSFTKRDANGLSKVLQAAGLLPVESAARR